MQDMTQPQIAEYDAATFELIQQAQDLDARLDRNAELMHRMAGDKKDHWSRRPAWSMNLLQVQEKLAMMVAAGDRRDLSHGKRPSEIIADRAVLASELTKANANINKREAVWQRQQWTRYFPCTNADGHIHRSLSGCPTVNRGLYATSMSWATGLSGKTVEEAITELGPTLCSVCFPGAPVEWCQSRREVTREQREAERAARAKAKADAEAAKEARKAERAARAAEKASSGKQTPSQRRGAAIKAIGNRYEELVQDRELAAAEIRKLAGLGRSENWQGAIEGWATLVENTENPMTWALVQGQIYAASAA